MIGDILCGRPLSYSERHLLSTYETTADGIMWPIGQPRNNAQASCKINQIYLYRPTDTLQLPTCPL